MLLSEDSNKNTYIIISIRVSVFRQEICPEAGLGVKIPAIDPLHASQPIGEDSAVSNAAPEIIVIDDDYELLNLITLLLRRIGVQPQTFDDGSEALNYLTQATPDLIILDLMLPLIDGFEILRQIRAERRFDAVPVLILSARADPRSIRRGLENGADGYVTKPYIANSLIDRVRLLLNTGRPTKSPDELLEMLPPNDP
jgi:CheY-like chemotaxis protein